MTMTIRYWAILLIAFGLSTGSEAAIFYVDPSCTHDGDGSVGEPCASAPAAAGPSTDWPTASGAGDQFLQKAGTTYLAQVTVGSGSLGNPVTIGAYGTGAKPILRSEEDAATGTIKINTDAHDIVIDGLEVHGQLNLTPGTQANAIRNNVTGGDRNIVVNITVQNCRIADVYNFGTSGNDGLDLNGRGLIVLNNEFDNIEQDAVGLSSDGADGDVIVRGNTCTNISIGGTDGDCYSIYGTSTGALFEDNYCDHSAVDSKYCIIANTPSPTIRYNELHGYLNATVNSLIYCEDAGCLVYGNTTYMGYAGVQLQGSGGRAYSNLIVMPSTSGIEVGGDAAVVANNTIIGSTTINWGIRLQTATTGGIAVNNILSDVPVGIFLYSASGHSESTNLFHNTVPTPVYNGTTSTPLAATNSVTASNQFLSDYRTIGNSTARRASISGYPCTDVRGRACYPNRPDIGAYQSTSGDPAGPRAARQ